MVRVQKKKNTFTNQCNQLNVIYYILTLKWINILLTIRQLRFKRFYDQKEIELKNKYEHSLVAKWFKESVFR